MFPARPVLRIRVPRRNLSRSVIHRQCRYNTTASTGETPAPTKRRISLRPYIYATAFIALGLTAGNLVRFALVPLAYPSPFTLEDDALIARLTNDIDALDIVQKMRAASLHLHADTAASESPEKTASNQHGQDSGWREVLVDSVADVETDINTAPMSAVVENDSIIPSFEAPITRTLTKKSCAGARGLGVQRVFWNSTTRELVAVVWFGGAVSGWPGLAHGGAIATVFIEALSRALVGPDKPLDSVPDPSSLALTYVKPTQASHFYVIRACISSPETVVHAAVPVADSVPPSSWFTWLSPGKDLTKRSQGPFDVPTVEISGTLENLDGKVCVKAKATWPATVR